MIHKHPSNTFIKLYNLIITDFLTQICNQNRDYCVKDKIKGIPLIQALWETYNKYELEASSNMHSSRLDRHKIASCICGTIAELQPIVGINGVQISRSANEILALYTGLGVIKSFMMNDIYEKSNEPNEIKNEIKNYIKTNFEMTFPSIQDNICDSQEYKKNITNALFWCHRTCHYSHKECFRYDIWAYAKIFYHLEVYNRPRFNSVVQEYRKHLSIS